MYPAVLAYCSSVCSSLIYLILVRVCGPILERVLVVLSRLRGVLYWSVCRIQCISRCCCSRLNDRGKLLSGFLLLDAFAGLSSSVVRSVTALFGSIPSDDRSLSVVYCQYGMVL